MGVRSDPVGPDWLGSDLDQGETCLVSLIEYTVGGGQDDRWWWGQRRGTCPSLPLKMKPLSSVIPLAQGLQFANATRESFKFLYF